VVALQEVRCRLRDFPLEVLHTLPWRGHLTYQPGVLPGRNGVALLTREAPVAVRSWSPTVYALTADTDADSLATLPAVDLDDVPLSRALRPHADHGRYIEVDLADAPLTVASVYVPKGGSPFDDTAGAHEAKMGFLEGFTKQIGRARRAALAQEREYLLLGDVNIAHTAIDLANPKGNVKNPGFLPVEREWLSGEISPRRLVDVVRRLHPDTPGPYSWWSWRGQAFTNDSGWRIDYHLATPGLAQRALSGGTDRDASYEVRISDHAPVTVDYEI